LVIFLPLSLNGKEIYMSTIIETHTGKVKGTSVGGLTIFKGIPYAADTAGDLRFSPPVPPEPWNDVFDATEFGNEAPQGPSMLDFGEPPPQSEDCLKLNIWTPGTDTARRPVMLWLHGGGFITGGAARPLYDGSYLATCGDVVVVTINYRLGVLGFLTHPSLTDEAGGAAGNWGLLDQIAALEWVRDNIELFGGDPDNVTIFGESAGGTSVGLLMAAPGARGLFKRAISQSGPPLTHSFEHAVDYAEKLFKKLGCEVGDVKKLREIDVDTILQAQIANRKQFDTWPAVDGVVIPQWPMDAVDEGLTEGVELMAGCNRDEAKLFLLFDPRRNKLDEANLLRRLEKALPGMHSSGQSNGARVLEVYREARTGRGESVDPWQIWCSIHSDRMMREPILRFAQSHSSGGRKCYVYLFTWESPNKDLGSCHALELPFMFGTLRSVRGIDKFAGKGPESDRLSELMQDAWPAFAKGGDPATEATGPWPGYDTEKRATMILGTEYGIQNAPYEPERRIWEEIDSTNFLNW